MNDAFHPTHAIPEGGLDARAEPHPAQPPVARLDQWLEVEVTEELGAWAHVRCSNGWTAWVDGRVLVARAAPVPPPAPTPTPAPAPAPTHAPVPVQGTLPPGEYARLYAQAQTRAVATGDEAAALPWWKRSVTPIGGLVAAASCVLPWQRAAGFSIDGLTIPVQFLFDNKTTATSRIAVGGLVALVGIVGAFAAAIPGATRVRRSCGWGVVVIASLYVAQIQRVLSALPPQGRPGLFSTIGFGVFVAIAGGLLLALGPDAKETP